MDTIAVSVDLPDGGARINRTFGDTGTVLVKFYPNRTLGKFLDSIELASHGEGGNDGYRPHSPVYVIDRLKLYCGDSSCVTWDTRVDAHRRLCHAGVEPGQSYTLKYEDS